MKLLVAVAILLAGCASDPPRVTTDVKVERVYVKVAVPCIKPEEVPQRPPSAMPPPGTAEVDQNTAGALADARALRDPGQYLDQVDVLIKRCTIMDPPNP